MFSLVRPNWVGRFMPAWTDKSRAWAFRVEQAGLRCSGDAASNVVLLPIGVLSFCCSQPPTGVQVKVRRDA